MECLSEVEGKRFEFSGVSMWERFVGRVHKDGDNVAIVCTHQKSGQLSLPNTDLDDAVFQQNPYLRVKYCHLAEAINKFANALLEKGAGPGTPIISFMPNLVEYSVAIWAAIKLGCTWVPINPRNLLNRQEVTHMIQTALSLKSSRSAVFLAGDVKIAQSIDGLHIDCQMTRILVGDESRDKWVNLSSLLNSTSANHPRNPMFSTTLGPADIVLFTSGTTSLPKGVRWPADSLADVFEARMLERDHNSTDVSIVAAPNNHAIGLVIYSVNLLVGATLVHPGPAFDPQNVMDTILRESVTQISLVPTMVHALISVKSRSGGKPSSLKRITLGGSMVSPQIVEKCLKELGAQVVHNVWGMTEGCTSTNRSGAIHELIDGDNVAIGYAQANSKMRVCGPNSKDPLPRGVLGELHISGSILVDGYIGKQSDDFYTDKSGCHWFITGDQAIIDEKDRVFITGRYKEMIIRGAENIAPAAIETTLSQVPQIMPLEVQIVGARDAIAGEVPVAIYKGKSDQVMAQNIQQTVLSRIGPAHVPDQVLALEELGLSEYPRTMAGKIQKNKLAALVQDFRDRQEQSSSLNGTQNHGTQNGDIGHSVRNIWKRALGYEVDDSLAFASFADSITIMKTRDMIAKELGKQISLAEMIEANNIVGQIKMLQEMPQEVQARRPQRPPRQSPVAAKDVIAFQQNQSTFKKSRLFIESVLAKHDLIWNEVADIVPVYDFLSITNQQRVMDSWTFTIITLTKMKEMNGVRSALKKLLSKWPVTTSLMLWNRDAFGSSLGLSVLMRQTDKFLDRVIHDHGSVRTIEDLKRFTESYPIKNAATFPGPLLAACLVFVEETQTVAIAFKQHHAMMDASSTILFFEALDNVLGGQPLPLQTDYKLWADSYYSLRTSLDGQLATKYHVNRLKGVSSQRRALWVDLNTHRAEEPVLKVHFEIPDILTLRHLHPEISAPVILKTAYSLMLHHRSKHSHVVFTNPQACRERFPFVPSALQDWGYDYSATDVAGPTFVQVFNNIEIRPQETVLSLLARMQSDQDDLTKYASAPLDEIFRALDPADSAFWLETLQTFRFNWVPGFGVPRTHANFENVAVHVRPEVRGISLNSGLGGDKGATIFMDIHSPVLSTVVRKEIAREIEGIIGWMVEEGNWESEVGGYVEGIRRVKGMKNGVGNGGSVGGFGVVNGNGAVNGRA